MKPHEEWMLKAEHDLMSAEMLVQNPDLLDTAVYHTQQCAEKALKGFLVFHEWEIEKTHHLKPILEACMQIDKTFVILTEEAISLSPFATEFRYPDEILMPELEDALQAISSARRIFEFVKSEILISSEKL
jgi:HEPN domain-containing protein